MKQALARLIRRTRDQHDFLRAVVSYGLSQGVMKGADLASFTLLVRNLTPAQFGFIGVMTISTVIVVDLLAAGVPRIGVPRFAVDPAFGRSLSYRNGASFIALYAVGIGLLAAAAPRGMFAPLGMGGSATAAFRVIIAAHLCRAFAYMNFEILRLERRARLLSILEPVPSLMGVLILYAAFKLSPDGLMDAAWSQVLPWAAVALGFAAINLRDLRPDLSIVRRIAGFSGPVTLQRTMDEWNNAGDRWVVLLVLGAGAAGAYTFLYRIGDVMKMVATPVQKAFVPQLLKHVDAGEERQASTVALLSFSASLALFFAALVLTEPLARLIDHHGRYAWTYTAIPAVIFANLIYQAYNIVGVGFYLARKSASVLPITVTVTAVNLVGSWLLARYAGVLYVAYATVASNTVLVLACHHFGRRHFRYGDPRVTGLVFGGLGVAAVAFGIRTLLP